MVMTALYEVLAEQMLYYGVTAYCIPVRLRGLLI